MCWVPGSRIGKFWSAPYLYSSPNSYFESESESKSYFTMKLIVIKGKVRMSEWKVQERIWVLVQFGVRLAPTLSDCWWLWLPVNVREKYVSCDIICAFWWFKDHFRYYAVLRWYFLFQTRNLLTFRYFICVVGLNRIRCCIVFLL